MRLTALALLLGLCAPARASLDPKLVDALAYVRDAQDGGALWDYLRRDPLPIVFARLPPGEDGRYRLDGRGRGWIELSDRLRRAPRETIGAALYRAYIHRLEDRAPQLVTPAEMNAPAGYAVAMAYLRDQVRPGKATPQAPRCVRRLFLRRAPARTPLARPLRRLLLRFGRVGR